MEQKIYDVLCEIRDEIRALRSDVSQIRGIGNYMNDINDVCCILKDISDQIDNK